MSHEMYIALGIVAAVVLYVLAKVVYYVRKSRAQWRQVDRSKLRTWDDDDDWPAPR